MAVSSILIVRVASFNYGMGALSVPVLTAFVKCRSARPTQRRPMVARLNSLRCRLQGSIGAHHTLTRLSSSRECSGFLCLFSQCVKVHGPIQECILALFLIRGLGTGEYQIARIIPGFAVFHGYGRAVSCSGFLSSDCQKRFRTTDSSYMRQKASNPFQVT